MITMGKGEKNGHLHPAGGSGGQRHKVQLDKGLRCGGVGTGDYAAISNVLGSSVGTIALWYYARGPWYNYQTVLDNPLYQDYWSAGFTSTASCGRPPR